MKARRARFLVACSLATAVAGLALLALGVVTDPSRTCFAYLEAWTFGVTICIGALLLLMIGHAAKANWMVVTRRFTEAIVDGMPVFLVLFVPVALSLARIYPWASHVVASDPEVRRAIAHKSGYLNAPFFIIRSGFYFLVFISLGALLRAWSKANDARPRMALVHRMRRLSGGGLPLVALTLTWASFDWTMSLQPAWSSTIFGLYVFAGSFVGAIAAVCVMAHFSQSVPRTPASSPGPFTADHAQALGRVLFAMVVFWAYMAFSQLLIYWIGNVPAEVTFFAVRTTGVVVGRHLAPRRGPLRGAVLRAPQPPDEARPRLPRRRSARGCSSMHFVDTYWLILPVYDSAGFRPHWLDAGAVMFVGGLSCAWIVRRYVTAARLPRHAQELAEGLDYEAAV